MWRQAVLAMVAAATLAGVYTLARVAARDLADEPQPTARTRASVAPAVATAVDHRPAAPAHAESDSEFPTQPDSTGLLQQGLSVGGLLDEIDADQGADFAPVDRERFTSVIRSDPELRKAFGE